MSHNTRSAGLAFLLSLLVVTGVAVALNFFVTPNQGVGARGVACRQSYTLTCLL